MLPDKRNKLSNSRKSDLNPNIQGWTIASPMKAGGGKLHEGVEVVLKVLESLSNHRLFTTRSKKIPHGSQQAASAKSLNQHKSLALNGSRTVKDNAEEWGFSCDCLRGIYQPGFLHTSKGSGEHKSRGTNCLLCAVLQPQSLWMYNSAKKTHYSGDLLCSLLVCCALLSVLTRHRYTISLDYNPFIRVDSHYHPPPPSHTHTLFFLFLSKVNLMQPDSTCSPSGLKPKTWRFFLFFLWFFFF